MYYLHLSAGGTTVLFPKAISNRSSAKLLATRAALLFTLLTAFYAGNVALAATTEYSIPPPGVPHDQYLGLPASAEGPSIDPDKGYRLQKLGEDLYMDTDNAYQAMFLVYDEGVVSEFLSDIKTVAAEALRTTKVGDGVSPRDSGNPWAVYDVYMDKVAGKCVAKMTEKWASRLGGGLRRVHLGSLHRHAGKPSGGVITTSTTENKFKPEVKIFRKEQTNDRTNNTQTRSKLPIRL